MKLTGILPVEGALRDAMRRTGCDPACHACGSRIPVGGLGAFRPALTLYGPEWIGGSKHIQAFRCTRCLDRALPPRERLRMCNTVLDARDAIIAHAEFGLSDTIKAASLCRIFGVVPIGDPRRVPVDGWGYWLSVGEELHEVFINGKTRYVGYRNMIYDSVEGLRDDYRKTVGLSP